MQEIKEKFAWADMTVPEILAITNNIKQKLSEFKKTILQINKTELTFENYIHASEILSSEISRLDGVLFGFVNLSTDKEIQKAARKVELEVSKVLNEFVYDEDVYEKFKNYYEGNFKKEKKKLTEEQIKVVEDSARSYKKIGMHLDRKNKKKLLEIKNKINKIAQDYDLSLVENYKNGLWFEKEELKGIPEENFANFKFDKKTKKYFVNCSGRDDLGTDYPILKKYCTVAKTREVATRVNEEAVGMVNNRRLAQILKLRNEIVKILGFKSWANLAMDEEMMSEPSVAGKFLEDLIKKLQPSFFKHNKKLAEILRKNTKEKLTTASYAFAENLLNGNSLPVKEEDFKPYFELENVLNVLFTIWEKYFGIKTEYIPEIKIFHESSRAYKFSETATGNLLGYGVFDLHPRDDKYGHACVADIFKKYVDISGGKHEGFTFMICNFKKANSGKTFISLSDMGTLFHEAGHMLHMILMKNNYVSTGHTSRDFVEIPSQFHENFLLNKNFVKENFKHFETGEEMSRTMLENISKFLNKGELKTWIRVITSSIYDQEVHSKNILKYAKNPKLISTKYEDLWKKYVKIDVTSKNRHWPSQWGHIVGGYDARYYSYVISKVYAQDFWHEFAKHGVKSGKMSEKYKKFLEGANTKPEKELVKIYLGRKVSMKPFLEILKD